MKVAGIGVQSCYLSLHCFHDLGVLVANMTHIVASVTVRHMRLDPRLAKDGRRKTLSKTYRYSLPVSSYSLHPEPCHELKVKIR